ncbi:MAG TPA: penicillin acylase family protein [Myxococcales bacterium]|nr:penicillin acylase family protein [Myxococcales bacterium]
MRRRLALAALCCPLAAAAAPVRPAGLHAAAEISRDAAGISHIRAGDEHDLFFLQGWVHAEDRLFQMDVQRRQAAGTLAELLGPGALPSDVQLRTLGLKRAAARSLPLLSARAQAALDAYAQGVNASRAAHPLPPEYAALKLTTFAPWTALDSAAIGKLISFGLSFDLDDISRTVALVTYQKAGAALGFDGTALFFQDVFRSAPFDPASTIPDASMTTPPLPGRRRDLDGKGPHPRAAELGKQLLDSLRSDRFLRFLVEPKSRAGSNQWAISGRFTDTGDPLLASDPHLALGAPSVFYPVHLRAGDFDAIGNSFPGSPGVIVGHNRNVAWGATVNPLDVTDVFQEQVVPDAASPSGLSTVFQGRKEPLIPIPQSYFVNQGGTLVPVPSSDQVPAVTLISPRRNQGPIVQFDPKTGVALSVQYTGFSGTRELDTFLAFDTARDVFDVQRAMPTFDVGSQNFICADTRGNIAYFTSSEVPIREDLQAGKVQGLPPFFIRDGSGGNEWLPVQHPQPAQAIPFEILPLDEMPHLVNPPSGFLINANNDPIGITLGNNPLSRARPGGTLPADGTQPIYYLNPGYDFGLRAGRITARVRERLARRAMTFEEMQSIQADVKLLDAQVLVPSIVSALQSAQRPGAPLLLAALAASPNLAQAVARLAAWDFSTPTGIPEGFDASDVNGRRAPPSAEQIDGSVAATLYTVWRGQAIRSIIDAHIQGLPLPPDEQAMTALRNLLDQFPARHGVGISGIDFFAIPGLSASAADRRDILLLQALRSALDRLSGPPFAAAFGGSTNLLDYRWGKLHRIVFEHVLGGPFSVPPAFGRFPDPLPDLAGIPTDGGVGTVDVAAFDLRAQSVDDFMFGHGPSNRLVVSLSHHAEHAESVWPGGVSGRPDSPFYLNLLPLWLTNDTVPLFFARDALEHAPGVVTTRFVPE